MYTVCCKFGGGSSEMLIIGLVSAKLPTKLKLFSLAIRIKNNIYYGKPKYSETSLKWTLAGQKRLSTLERCRFGEVVLCMRVSLRIGPGGTNYTVRLREVSALGRFHCIQKYLPDWSSKKKIIISSNLIL